MQQRGFSTTLTTAAWYLARWFAFDSQAPVPFIFGIHSSVRATIDEACLREIVVVDLDAGTVQHDAEGWMIKWATSAPDVEANVSGDGDTQCYQTRPTSPNGAPPVQYPCAPSSTNTTASEAASVDGEGTGAPTVLTPDTTATTTVSGLPRNPGKVMLMKYTCLVASAVALVCLSSQVFPHPCAPRRLCVCLCICMCVCRMCACMRLPPLCRACVPAFGAQESAA